MMQSRQVSDRALIEILVQTYYTDLYRLALILLRDAPASRRAATQAIAVAVDNRYRFWGHQPLRVWLVTLMVSTSRQARLLAFLRFARRDPAAELLGPYDRLSLILVSIYGLTIAEVSAVLGASERSIAKRLEQAAAKLHIDLKGLSDSDSPEASSRREQVKRQLGFAQERRAHDDAGLAEVEAEIDLLLAARRRKGRNIFLTKVTVTYAGVFAFFAVLISFAGQAIPKAATTIPAPSSIIQAKTLTVQATPTQAAHRTPEPTFFVRTGEGIDLISRETGIDVYSLREANGLIPGAPLRPGEKLIVDLPHESIPEPLPSTYEAGLMPLTGVSKMEEISQRMGLGAEIVKKVWIEGTVIDYGPPDYTGPPVDHRVQLWFSRDDDYWLALSGPFSGVPDFLAIWNYGFISEYRIDPGVEHLLSGDEGQLDAPTTVLGFLYPEGWASLVTGMQVIGVDHVAGLRALVLDSVEERPERRERLWVDSYTGILLRTQTWNGDTLERDVMLTQVVYLAPISVFRVRNNSKAPSNFARGPDGEPLPPLASLAGVEFPPAPGHNPWMQLPPPAGFDPAGSPLSFEWTDLAGFFGSERDRVNVFAGGYFLGSTYFTDIYSQACLRSPDGSRVAFLYSSNLMNVLLGWFRLDDVSTLHEPLPPAPGNFYINEYVFAPDSRSLAMYGCVSTVGCAVYLLDMENDVYSALLEIETGNRIAWSPGGEYLAVLGVQKPSNDMKIFVLEVSTGEIVYTSNYDWITGTVPDDAPTHTWGIDYPNYRYDTTSCMEQGT